MQALFSSWQVSERLYITSHVGASQHKLYLSQNWHLTWRQALVKTCSSQLQMIFCSWGNIFFKFDYYSYHDTLVKTQVTFSWYCPMGSVKLCGSCDSNHYSILTQNSNPGKHILNLNVSVKSMFKVNIWHLEFRMKRGFKATRGHPYTNYIHTQKKLAFGFKYVNTEESRIGSLLQWLICFWHVVYFPSWCAAFHFLNNHVGKCTHVHIPGWQYQVSLDPNCGIVVQCA